MKTDNGTQINFCNPADISQAVRTKQSLGFLNALTGMLDELMIEINKRGLLIDYDAILGALTVTQAYYLCDIPDDLFRREMLNRCNGKLREIDKKIGKKRREL